MGQSAKGDSYPELRINADSMEKLRDVVNRREGLQDLVSKAESNKEQVKTAIYTKVIADYKNRLKGIADEFAPASEDVKKQLEEIQKREQDIRARLQEVTDDLEEQRFRCEIGEFSNEELEPIEKEMTEVKNELNEQIEVLEATYEECSRCLAEDSVATLAPNEVRVERPLTPEVKNPQTKQPAPPPPPADAAADDETTQTEPPKTVAAAQALKSVGEHKSPKVPSPPKAKEPEPLIEKTSIKPRDTEPTSLADKKTATSIGGGIAIKVLKKDGDSDVYPLRSEKLSIGRSPKSDIVIKLAGVSRTHAHVVRNPDGQYSIIDTSGGGGLKVNGSTLKKANLRQGDKITIASTEMEVVTG